MSSTKFINTDCLREAAIHHQTHGCYTFAIRGTKEYKLYWDRELERSLYGYEGSNGIWITGYHYFYLNYCPITRLADEDEDTVLDHAEDKDADFPSFWDGDYHFFMAVEACENPGNKRIHYLNPTGKRKHLVVLKARGKGYSFKCASMCARNYYLIRKSKSFCIANEKEFLINDGILTKCWEYLDFIDTNTAWAKRRLVDKPMHKQAGFLERKDGIQTKQGYKSQIIGVSLKNDYQKARGKRGKLVLFEEGGKFPNLDKAWQIARPSVEDTKRISGLLIAFGTGGTEGGDFQSLEKMFYKPIVYNALEFENVFDEGGQGTKAGFFHPMFWNAEGFMDKEGNSLVEPAKEFELGEREAMKQGGAETNDIDQRAAENPLTPREACLQTSSNIFPKQQLQRQVDRITIRPEYQIGIPRALGINAAGKLEFTPLHKDEKAVPIEEFPTPTGLSNLDGTIVVYQDRYVDPKTGKPPEGLYYIANDPFAQEQGASLGATYVMKNMNRYSQPDDIIVASYIGRPSTTQQYDRNLLNLAEYYGCKVGFENDRGDVKGNALMWHKQHLLEPQFQLTYVTELEKSKVDRPFGMHMTPQRKRIAVGYVYEWLMRERGDGSINIDHIYDKALLQELIKWEPKGNYDRVSALMIAMFYQKEIEWGVSKDMYQEEVNEDNDFITRFTRRR